MSPSRVLATLAAALVAAGCAELPDVPRGTCGNAVVEPGEDCDGFAVGGVACRAPGAALACRFDCSAGPCPPGFRCGGTDHVCREPTGRFDAPVGNVDGTAERLLAGDLDGDGRADLLAFGAPDLLGTATPRAYFFDHPADAPTLSYAVRAAGLSPRLVDLDGSPELDLVMSTDEGLVAFLGRSDKRLAPKAFPSYSFPPHANARVLGVATAPAHPALGMIFAEFVGASFLGYDNLVSDAQGNLPAISSLPGSPADIAGDPVAANLDEASPCDEVVWAQKKSPTVWLARACHDDGTPISVSPKPPLALPAPVTALSVAGRDVERVLAADVDGDGHLDLAVVSTAAGTPRVDVAFGRGDGQFFATPAFQGKPATPTPVVLEGDEGSREDLPILAMSSRVTGGMPGLLVLPTGLAWVKSVAPSAGKVALSVLTIAQQTAGEFTVARIADLDGDHVLDVVAGSASSNDLTFYGGVGDGRFNEATISTELPVSALSVGDYDGDLVADLAIAERGAGEDDDLLEVAYGRRQGAPEPPTPVGRFASIRQIASGEFRPGSSVADLAVVFAATPGRGATADDDRIAILPGNGDRLLVTPFGLASAASDGSNITMGTPLGLDVGRFGADAPRGIAVLAVDAQHAEVPVQSWPLHMWLVPVGDDAELASANASARVDDAVLVAIPDGDRVTLSKVVRAGDLDGDGVDEAVALVTTGKSFRTDTLVVFAATKTDRGVSFVERRRVAIQQPASGPVSASDLALVDVDGDGALDAVVLLGGVAVRALWNDGAGAFSSDRAADLATGEGLAFTPIQADGDPELEIAVGGAGLGVLVDAPARVVAAREVAGLAGATALAAGDLDGDGLDDLALGDAQTRRFRFLLATPRLP